MLEFTAMTSVTRASIAYVATQVSVVPVIQWISYYNFFASRLGLRCRLQVSSVGTDTITDLERFYNSILELLEEPDEFEEDGFTAIVVE